jgi:addiction module HigA family antidote
MDKIMPPVHPGEILKEEFLSPLGVSPNRPAVRIGVPSQRIHEILAGKRAVTLNTALRLAAFFGASHILWLGLQADYEYQIAEDKGLAEHIAEQVQPMKSY